MQRGFAAGVECFVPHEEFGELTELTPVAVYRVGAVCWSVDEAVEALPELESQPR